MQVLQAGRHKLLLLELDPEFLGNLAQQAGFEFELQDHERYAVLELTAQNRQAPLLLFDAADPGNLGWFSRCQFYVNGGTGNVLQTPISIANSRDRHGHLLRHSLRVKIAKELPTDFRMPGRQPVNEQVVYAILYNLLAALANVGVAVCGGDVVRPLAGRSEHAGSRH